MEEFEAGIIRMKGYARSIDLNKLDRQMQKMHEKVDMLVNASALTGVVLPKPAKKFLQSPTTSAVSAPRGKDIV